MITTNYMISYFNFNFDRKSTFYQIIAYLDWWCIETIWGSNSNAKHKITQCSQHDKSWSQIDLKLTAITFALKRFIFFLAARFFDFRDCYFFNGSRAKSILKKTKPIKHFHTCSHREILTETEKLPSQPEPSYHHK